MINSSVINITQNVSLPSRRVFLTGAGCLLGAGVAALGAGAAGAASPTAPSRTAVPSGASARMRQAEAIETDVIVCGGGPAGMAAAWAAARGGARVLLIERHGYVGGNITAANLTWVINWKVEVGGKRVDLAGRFYKELMARLHAAGAHYPDPGSLTTDFDVVEPEDFKFIAEAMLLEAGCRLRYHTLISGVEVKGERIKAVHLTGKGGPAKVRCMVMIDATGDGDAFTLAGADFVYGRESDGLWQPMTMLTTVAGVDVAEAARGAGIKLHYNKYYINTDKFDLPDEGRPTSGSMTWSTPRDSSQVTFNWLHVSGLRGERADELAEACVRGRRQARQMVDYLRAHVPGYRNAWLLRTGEQIGVRESRRIKGRATITEEDVAAGKIPADSISLAGYYMDTHLPGKKAVKIDRNPRTPYGIPYGALVSPQFVNALAAGRCISGTHLAAGSYRVMGTVMNIGEAAGTAAAQAIRKKTEVADLDGAALRQTLESAGALPRL
ncbi:MAG: FAD-dependent oxidoreductase [bacterium]|nr:FAD-dependent oxidoreductase [bacterium]